MFSTMVTRRRKAAQWLRGKVISHGSRPAKALEERMKVVLEEGEQVPDVEHFIDVVSRLLALESRELMQVDRERRRGIGTAGVKRVHFRNPAAAELRGMIVTLRKGLIGIYGNKETNHFLHIKGRTPRGYEDLVVFGKHVVWALRSAELPELADDIGLDRGAWADKIEQSVDKLEANLEGVRKINWDQDAVLEKRDRQLGSFDGDYGMCQ